MQRRSLHTTSLSGACKRHFSNSQVHDKLQVERAADLERDLAVARDELETMRSTHVAPANPDKNNHGARSPEREVHQQHDPDMDGRLAAKDHTIARLQGQIADLQSQLESAKSKLDQWEGTAIQPEDLEALRTGNADTDKALSQLSSRVQHYMRLYQEAQGRYAMVVDKQQELTDMLTRAYAELKKLQVQKRVLAAVQSSCPFLWCA